MKLNHRCKLLAIVGSAWIVGLAAIKAAPAAGLAESEREVVAPADAQTRQPLAGETFDAAWRILRDSYFDPSFHGLNWDGVRAELLPKAEAAHNIPELRAVIQEMLDRLGGSHMALIPGDVANSLEKGQDDSDRATRSKPRTSAGSAESKGTPKTDAVG